MKKRAPPGEANCVVVRHTASDGSKGLHLRAIATMAPGTQLTITSRVGAKISALRPCHRLSRRFEEPTEAKADAMDVDDDNGAAPMLVEPRPAEDHLQPMSDELDGDGAPSTEDGVLLLPRGLFDALDDDDDETPVAPSDPADFFPSATGPRARRATAAATAGATPSTRLVIVMRWARRARAWPARRRDDRAWPAVEPPETWCCGQPLYAFKRTAHAAS